MLIRVLPSYIFYLFTSTVTFLNFRWLAETLPYNELTMRAKVSIMTTSPHAAEPLDTENRRH